MNRLTKVLCVIAVLAFSVAAWAQHDPSGKKGTVLPVVTTSKAQVLAQTDDGTQRPVQERSIAYARSFDVTVQSERAARAVPAWQKLQSLDLTEKNNAKIELEPLGDASAVQREEFARIAQLWNAGKYDSAVEHLRVLHESGDAAEFALGISWKEPRLLNQALWGPDVQVGIKEWNEVVVLDADSSSGNLFVATLNANGGTLTNNWTVNMSADGGATWMETYDWNAGYDINDIDAVIVDGYFYVGYIGGTDQDEARVRRVSVLDGQVDTDFGFWVAFDKDIEITDIALASDEDMLVSFPTYTARLYYLGIHDDNTLSWFWAKNDTDWTEKVNDIDDAARELDVCYNFDPTTYYLYASYIDTEDTLYVARVASGGAPDPVAIDVLTGGNWFASISAYRDRIMVVYEYGFAEGPGVKYQVSYDDGDTWRYGVIVEPATASDPSFYCPDVTGRRGGGFSAVYYESGMAPINPTLYTHRNYGTGPGTAQWSAPERFNETRFSSLYKPSVESIPPFMGYSADYGVTWIGADSNTVQFDYLGSGTLVQGEVQPSLPEKYALRQSYPNPFNSRAAIRYTIPHRSEISVRIYNVSGQLLRTLTDALQGPGDYTVFWDGKDAHGRDVTTGVYFYRLDAEQYSQTKKMLLLR